MIRVKCSACSEMLQFKEKAAGRKVRCPSCQEVIEVPLPDADDFIDDDEIIEEVSPSRRRSRGSQSARKAEPSSTVKGLAVGAGVGAVVLGLLYALVLRTPATNPEVANANNPASIGAVATTTSPDTAPSQTPPPAQPEGPRTVVATGKDLFPVNSVPLPVFPTTAEPYQPSADSAGKYRTVDLAKVSGQSTSPGCRMKLILYLPNKPTIPEKSLGCIIVPSAGSNLLSGTDCHADDYRDETLPYVQKGYAVLGLSLDGAVDDSQKLDQKQIVESYTAFKAAHAGLVNVRNAMGYLKRHVPEVDPKRVHIAGHSSAGTLALLSAAHFPELGMCLAYAPACDLPHNMKDIVTNPRLQQLLPGLKDFVEQQSPMKHAWSIKCPVFLFHAKDDKTVPQSESQDMRWQIRLYSPNVPIGRNFHSTGGHYDSMIQRGIPAGTEFLMMAEASLRAGGGFDLIDPDAGKVPVEPRIDADREQVGRLESTNIRPDAPPGAVILVLNNINFKGKGDLALIARYRLGYVPSVQSSSVKYHPETKQLSVFAPGKQIILSQVQLFLSTGGIESKGAAVFIPKH